MSDRSHPRVRKWSLVLSSLALTPDAGLETFRERRALDPRLPVERLRKARAVLDAVAQAIESVDAGRWSRIEQAFDLLGRDAAFDPSVPVMDDAPLGPPKVAKISVATPTLAAPRAESEPSPLLPSPVHSEASAPIDPRPLEAAPLSPPAVMAERAPGPSLAPMIPEAEESASVASAPTVPSPGPILPAVVASSVAVSIATEPPKVRRPVAVTGAMPAFQPEAKLPFIGGGPRSPDADRAPVSTGEAPGTVLPFGGKKDATQPAAASDSPMRPASLPQLTVEQFASFVVERELYPATIDSVRTRYGIVSPEVESALERVFLDRFAREPAARQLYEDVRSRYRAWLESRR